MHSVGPNHTTTLRYGLCSDSLCEKCFNKSLASINHIQWSSRNKLLAREVTKSNNNKGWFICNNSDCEHEFEATIYNMSRKAPHGCPYCNKRSLCNNDDCKNCFNNSFASSTHVKNWSSKNQLTSNMVFKNSEKTYWFTHECGHEFETSPLLLSRGNICPFCIGHALCENKDCKMCFEKSFSSVPYSRCWSEKNQLTPRQINKHNVVLFIFECDRCDHEFKSRPTRISNGRKCPYCSVNSKKLCDDTNCKICEHKSFFKHHLVHLWSFKNELSPRQVSLVSGEIYKFKCTCGREFETSIAHLEGKGNGCPCCSTRKRCDDKDCEICLEKTFQIDPRASFWSDKNELKPWQVFKNSGQKIWFTCEKKHEFHSKLFSITGGRWCPHCRHKTETILLEFLKETFLQYMIIKEAQFEWCVWQESGRMCRYDFAIEKLKLIIELDGMQHFKQVANWTSPEETQLKDVFKIQQANLNGFTIIRLLQGDVLYNRLDWQAKLVKHIKEYEIPSRIFICQNNEYNPYKKMLKPLADQNKE